MGKQIKTIEQLLHKSQITGSSKKALLQTFAAVHTELEQVKKLSRSNAVVLEKTSRALAQKTKALNLQERQLQIEASLEKVRTVALRMNAPEDMLQVCKTISEQLQSLGVNEIRNVQTAIFYPARGTYMNYEFYTKHNKTIVTETHYTNNKIHRAFAAKMQKGKGEYFKTHISGKKVKEWLAYQKTTNVFIDKFLHNAQSLSYYWYSLGPVALGISAYLPLKKEDEALFRRFLKVFELAYRRYMDIEKAHTQAQEARVQASLERVRAAAMAMHKSEHLMDVCETMYKEFLSLGFTSIRNAIINIHNDEDDTFINYDYAEASGKGFSRFTNDVLPFVGKIIKNSQRTSDAFSEASITGKALTEFKKLRQQAGQKSDPGLNKAKRLYFYFYSIGIGSIGISTFEKIGEEKIALLKQFRNVFALSYQRYTDIKNAEAQAREAQIQLALERVRARTMAMQHSDELTETSLVLFQQLKELGEPAEQFSIGVIKEEENIAEVSATLKGIKMLQTYRHEINEPYVLSPIFKAWKAKEKTLVIEQQWEELNAYNRFRNNMVQEDKFPVNLKPGDRRFLYVALFSKGSLALSSNDPRPPETLELLQRFAKVFDQTYTRFLDLQKAEAQAKESKIQLALERVRARTMAMQKSNELSETAFLLFQQFKQLGKFPDQITIGIINEPGQVIEFWLTIQGHQMNRNVKASIHEPTVMNKMYTGWATQKKSIVIDLTGKELADYIIYRNTLSKKIDAPESNDHHEGRRVINVAFFSKGFLTFSSPQPCEEESIELLERFAGVFDQTYTRFLDLQKAEAQAKEAQIETALERVRARTMGMQKSDELKEVIQVVYDQFVYLNINTEHTGFVMDYKATDDRTIWVADKHGINSQVSIPYFDTIYYNQFNEAKQKGLDFFATKLSFEEKNDFYQKLFTYIPSLSEEAKEFYFSCPGLAISTVLLENVGLYIENFLGTPFTTEENATLMRFGKVFQQTYTRFIDLQKAEAQAKEAKIETALEKVRSRSLAMHKSNELQEVVNTVFEQLNSLHVEMNVASIFIFKENSKDWEQWVASADTNYSTHFHLSYTDNIIFRDLDTARQNGKDFYTARYSFEEKNSWFTYAFANTEYSRIPEQRKIFLLESEFYLFSFALSKNVGLQLARYSGDNFSEIDNDILRRFCRVFEQAYIRFLDLQKAEAQAKEAQIEAALEKVRSRTMAMQSSNELQETAVVLFNEFKKLGTDNVYQVTIGIYNEAEGLVDFRVTNWAGSGEQENRSFMLDMAEPTVVQPSVAAWKAGKKSLVVDLTGEALEGWINYRNKMSGVTISSKDTEGRRVISIAYFSKGHISISSPLPVPPETIKTLERFAAVFDGTYTRFLDLEKAEAQAREAQIETALEKVRSRTLAMQKSDELAETAAEVFRQLISLGIEPNRLYIGIVKEETGDMEMWATDEDGTHIGKKFMFNKNENISVKKLFDGWKAKEKSVIVDMQGKELEDYFHYLNNVMHIPFKGGLVQKRRVQSVAYFSKGFIGMASPDGQGGETIQLLERFAAVFNLTFTRFNDLKIAEAHAQQAELDLIAIKEAKQKAEEAFTELQSAQKQLIQSEKMASLGELTAGIAHEIQNPLNFVNNFSEVSKELLEEMREAIEKGDTEDAKEIMNDVIQNLEKINHHGKRADGIVKGMLQHSRATSATKELTDINKLADEYLRLAYHGLRAKDKSFNASLKTDYDETLEKVKIIPQDMGRVILNLITNAFYVVDEKKKQLAQGMPNFERLASLYDPTVSVSTKKINDNVEIKVADNGNGIPKNILDKIFQPFFTTKPTGQGTGLGLSLAYDIVKAHGGELKVETKEGEGTIFTIQLPANA